MTDGLRQWRTRPALAAVLVLGAGLLAGGCHKPTPTDPTQTTTYIVTITASGLSPVNIDVPLGSRVLFTNKDTREHFLHSDPHPDATDCTALNQVGLLAANQQRETGNLVEVRVCGYHDHNDPGNTKYQGRITIH